MVSPSLFEQKGEHGKDNKKGKNIFYVEPPILQLLDILSFDCHHGRKWNCEKKGEENSLIQPGCKDITSTSVCPVFEIYTF